MAYSGGLKSSEALMCQGRVPPVRALQGMLPACNVLCFHITRHVAQPELSLNKQCTGKQSHLPRVHSL